MYILALIASYIGIVLITWGITRLVRQYALNKLLLDYPNQRSLHTIPTPRGGGLSIVLAVLCGIIVLWYSALIPYPIALAIGGGGLLVALTGWLDDKLNLAATWRLLLYLLSSIWACYWILALQDPTIIQYLIWTFALTWMINLYNFMDGSDALAAVQAIFTAVVTAIFLMSGQSALAIILLTLAASCTGFLFWNWPPAKIFMGDTGSCFIGFMFGVCGIITSNNGELSITVWLILLSLFISDATLTLIKRIITGERWYMAHRSHAYQLAIQSGLSHKQLIYSVLLIYVISLLPFSWVANRFEAHNWDITVFTYCMAVGLWLLVQYRYVRHGKIKDEFKINL